MFFLLSLALLLVIFVPVTLVSLVLSSADPESVGLVLLFVFFGVLLAILLLILISIPVYIIGQLALRELVLGGGRVFGSIGSGYGIFRRNLGRSLLVWVIQFTIALGVSIVLFIISLIIGLVLFALTSALSPTDYATVVVGLLIAIPSIVLSGIIGTFNSSYWTLAYLQLTAPPGGELSQPGQEV